VYFRELGVAPVDASRPGEARRQEGAAAHTSSATWRTQRQRGNILIIDLHSEDEEPAYDEASRGSLAALAPLRAT